MGCLADSMGNVTVPSAVCSRTEVQRSSPIVCSSVRVEVVRRARASLRNVDEVGGMQAFMHLKGLLNKRA